MIHVNLAGIRTREEPTEAPRALLVMTGGGCKGWGVLSPPVQYVSGGDPEVSSVSHHLYNSG